MKKILFFALSVIAFNANSQTLIYGYSFDGDTLDNSGNSNTLESFHIGGIYEYDQGASAGISDSCVHFMEGKGLRSTIAFNNAGWTATAVSFWFKAGNDNSGYIIQSGTGFGVQTVHDKISCFFDGSSGQSLVSTTNNLDDNNWHHVVCQNNGTNTSIYLDGVLNVNQPEILYTSSTMVNFYMGSANNGTSKISSFIDDMRIYDDTLSQVQIDDIINQSAGLVHKEHVSLTISPNPSSDFFEVIADGTISLIELRDMNGSVVLRQEESLVNIQAFEPGVYFIFVQTDRGMTSEKVVIQ